MNFLTSIGTAWDKLCTFIGCAWDVFFLLSILWLGGWLAWCGWQTVHRPGGYITFMHLNGIVGPKILGWGTFGFGLYLLALLIVELLNLLPSGELRGSPLGISRLALRGSLRRNGLI